MKEAVEFAEELESKFQLQITVFLETENSKQESFYSDGEY